MSKGSFGGCNRQDILIPRVFQRRLYGLRIRASRFIESLLLGLAGTGNISCIEKRFAATYWSLMVSRLKSLQYYEGKV